MSACGTAFVQASSPVGAAEGAAVEAGAAAAETLERNNSSLMRLIHCLIQYSLI